MANDALRAGGERIDPWDIDVLAELVHKVDALIAGPINQAGPFDADGMGPISQSIGDEYVAAVRVMAKYRPAQFAPRSRRRRRP